MYACLDQPLSFTKYFTKIECPCVHQLSTENGLLPDCNIDMKEIRSKKAFTAHMATYATDESDRYMTKHAKADFAL